jgi:predicted helicase
VEKHLLNRLFGFEILMAPYAIAHLKLGMQLEETGYSFGSDQRLGIFLTNTLEESARRSDRLFADWISEEANAAANVKAQLPIMVVLGNPPYAGHSANKGEWIRMLVRDYCQVDGQPLGERNSKWLQDDYVKFIRFAQWRIEKTGYGVLAYITNHGYLDNPTFRGMRQQLMHTFDELYVLDLHGSSKKQEKTPDGGKDENVFDIQQGVAILLAVKTARRADDREKHPARVFHAELWGERKGKYDWLWQNSAETTTWSQIEPSEPSYLFVPQNKALLPEYNQGWLVTKIYQTFASTVTTARNDFSMAYEPSVLVKRIDDLRNQSLKIGRASCRERV